MAHAWWRDADYELFYRLTRERDERTEQFRRAARIANELTLETQTPEEWTADLVRQVRQARAERDEWKRAADANMALAERNADTIDRLCDERDEARAEVARLREALEDIARNMRERGWEPPPLITDALAGTSDEEKP